jgi:PAS domain S-box-containing protein
MAELRETASRQAVGDSLQDSERPFHPAAENAPVAIACCDTEVRYKFVNGYYAKRHGVTPEQLVGKYAREVVGEQVWATLEPFFRECLAGKVIEFELEVESRYPADDWRFVHCYYEPEWKDGKVVGLIAAITNITGRKRAEQRLRESEATFRAMFDVSSVGKIEVDSESGYFLRANAAVCEFVGYTEAELLVRTVQDIATATASYVDA